MTTTNRIKAGGLPPLQLHRAQPVDFVMSDEEEQEVRNGFDQAMKAVIQKPQHVETASTEDEKDGAEEMIAALIVLVVFIGALAIWWSS